MATAFFNPVSPFGALTGWEVQSNNPTTSSTRAQQLGSAGDEIGKKLHDTKTSVSATYTLKTAASCKIPKFGEILSGYHVDSVSISFSNTGFVSMTVTGHKHGNTNHATCRTYTGSLTTIAANFGCPAAPIGFTIPANAGVRSFTYNLSGNHVDELGSEGEWLAGNNYDGNETCDIELCDTGSITAANGFDLTSAANAFSNTAAQTSSATVEKHLTGVDPT